MKRQVQVAGILLGVISFLGGLADIYMQYVDGGSIQWRVPLILIGTGVGLPLVIFPFFEWDLGPDPALIGEEEYAQLHSGGGFLGNLSGGVGSSEGEGYSGSDSDGDSGGD